MMKIKFSKKQIKQIEKIGVETIYLFGSYAKGINHSLSDVDIGIVFAKTEKYRDKTMDAYLKLYNIFTDVLPKEYLRRRFKTRAHEMDIVFLQSAPINLQFNAIRGAKILYEKDRKKRLEYEERVIKRYLDLNYLYNLSYKYLLERI